MRGATNTTEPGSRRVGPGRSGTAKKGAHSIPDHHSAKSTSSPWAADPKSPAGVLVVAAQSALQAVRRLPRCAPYRAEHTRGPAGCEEPAKGSVGRSQICFLGPGSGQGAPNQRVYGTASRSALPEATSTCAGAFRIRVARWWRPDHPEPPSGPRARASPSTSIPALRTCTGPSRPSPFSSPPPSSRPAATTPATRPPPSTAPRAAVSSPAATTSGPPSCAAPSRPSRATTRTTPRPTSPRVTRSTWRTAPSPSASRSGTRSRT